LWEPYRDRDFLLLGEGLNRSGIREYLELKVDAKTLQIKQFNKRKFKHLLEFIYGTKGDRRITETRQLSTLAKALSSPAAAAELEKGESIVQSRLQSDRARVAKLKAFLRAARPRSYEHVCGLIAMALDLFTPDECATYVRHCGYRITTS